MSEPAAPAATTPPADPAAPISKNAEKKKAKMKENEARLALKAAKAAKAAATATAGGEKKAKRDKEQEQEAPFVNTTPKGEKKDMSQPMPAGYNPIAVEAAWYDWWQAQGFFQPQLTQNGKVKPEGVFVIPSPPPNVTGSLHIGHALTVSIQDCLVRWNRMVGKTTLFVPGFDHAGISTQSVVEKRLYKTGVTRHDLGREKFVEKVWEWKEDYQGRITNQLQRLGGSYDWSRVAFTMNDSLSKAVTETFCTLHEEGILYRANRLVNWCVKLNTTLSNLEVDQKQLEGRTLLNVPGYDLKEKFEFGIIVSFAYPIEGSDEKIIVATTRPETMLGDTAVAVHSQDPRYKHLHGKFVKHPFVDRRIPIITDDIVVDMAFGTGAVKITPAHDPNDYEVGARHKLDFINILNDDGTFNENAGKEFKGMKRFHARLAVVQALKHLGLYVETKDNPMQIPICSKSGDVIEPILKPQWWVNCTPLAEEAVKRTRAGELNIAPKSSEAEWYRWLEGIQDWCISRQLWWGHRCPAYFVKVEGQDQDRNDGKHWVVGRTLEEAMTRAEKLVGDAKFTLEQDEDVLDTWFSSGLWPWSIQGWPSKTKDLEMFYPASLLETGWDILFFWVARMVILGVHLTGKMPFSEVYCHAMIRDAHGRKMSKSLGNVIDPLDVIQGLDLESLHQKLYEGNLDEREIVKAKAGQKKDFPKGIPQCGTDALRFALCAYSGGGRDINLEILRVEGYRKFCNKIFNATKFAMLKLDETFVPSPTAQPTGNESLVEKWILHKLNLASEEINKQLNDRNFMNATNAVYNFWLYELCDVYIEAMKPMTEESASETTRKSAQQTLYTCLDHGLRLLHPFMPYVTEELWQRLPRRLNDPTPSIMVSKYPTFDKAFEFSQAERDFDLVFSAVKASRALAAAYNVQQNLQVFMRAEKEDEAELFASQIPTFLALTKSCKSVDVVRDIGGVPAGCGSELLTQTIFTHILVRGQVDIDAEVNKCEKKLAIAKMSLSKIQKIESQADYESTVPENVRLANEERRKTFEADIQLLEHSIQMFTEMK
ncbi:tRNA synthetases class I-domain-containing protein [Epithele typhae]|uniref:tRNA synthetases class I-domain-containing protein n=1 Tax=Epithele typhae TaxID=378194 RepID=UPI0020080D55|nr:tRNA synthetases class I-domain-containing protein [Epithele typhae]KAH9932026.1 tRNA synthetases class I-domain-containing protein [Epithele typhae]